MFTIKSPIKRRLRLHSIFFWKVEIQLSKEEQCGLRRQIIDDVFKGPQSVLFIMFPSKASRAFSQYEPLFKLCS